MQKSFFITGFRQGVVIVLMALLGLAPFLHGHVGASHVSGFHVDGMDVSHSLATEGLSAQWAAHTASEEESPAMGVAVSLPQPADDAGLLVGIAGFLLWAWFVAPVQVQRVRRALLVRLPLPCTYQPGWPPPALAPPL
ncbi:MAG: hypothetical protein ACOYB1_14200 [Limnohabitans sp.]